MVAFRTETAGVLAKDVRPGDRILFGGRSLDVWRMRPAGAGAVTLDMHGVYLRVAADQPLLRATGDAAPRPAERELVAA